VPLVVGSQVHTYRFTRSPRQLIPVDACRTPFGVVPVLAEYSIPCDCLLGNGRLWDYLQNHPIVATSVADERGLATKLCHFY